MHVLEDVGRLFRELRENNTDGEELCELSAKWYAKNLGEKPMNRGAKRKRFLKNQKTLAVHLIKVVVFVL